MRGGAKEHLIDLTPEITDAKSLDDNCQFLYVSAHGSTNFETLQIVPENTFILFKGRSGLISYQGDDDIKWLITNDSREKYFQTLFSTYFHEGSSMNMKERAYYDQQVYIPGDILPSTVLDFKSGFQDIWYKGLYECPVKDEKLFLTLMTNDSYLILFLIKLTKSHTKEMETVFKNAEFIEDKRDELNRLMELDTTGINKLYEKNPESIDDIYYWFKKPEMIGPTFLDEYIMTSSPDNLIKDFNKLKIGKYTVSLERLLEYNYIKFPHPEKKYKFIIVSSCRVPTNILVSPPEIERKNQYKYMSANPTLLPKNTHTMLKVSRRMSFSSKDYCATNDDPPMNILKIVEALKESIKVPFPTPNIFQKEMDLESFLYFRVLKLDSLLSSIKTPYGGIDYKELEKSQYTDILKSTKTKESITLRTFKGIIDMSFDRFDILTKNSKDEWKFNKLEKGHIHTKAYVFSNLINAIHKTLGHFLVGIHMDTPESTRKGRTLGQLLLQQTHTCEYNSSISETIRMSQEKFIGNSRWNTLTEVIKPSQSTTTTLTQKNTTRKLNSRLADKDLINWKIAWNSGKRNSKLDSKMLNEWSRYRRTLSTEERKAQNKTLRQARIKK